MNPQIQSEKHLELLTNVGTTTDEAAILTQEGFTTDEAMSLLWLRQWYQSGGSDRVEVLHDFEALKRRFGNGKVES